MKRFIAIVLAALMLTALLCACGKEKTVTTKVAAEYDDGYAQSFADSSTKDADGDTVYEFKESQYDKYRQEHNNVLSADMQKDLAAAHDASYGEFVYINEDKQAVIVGIHEGKFNEEEAKKEAEALAEYGFKYFQSLQTPVSTIKVIYANANDQSQEFGTFEFTAE